jgi:hypothetical protein
VAKHKQVIFPLCLGEQEESTELKKAVWEWGDSTATMGESHALHYLGGTRNKLKLIISPRKKLISNSQACPASGRGW